MGVGITGGMGGGWTFMRNLISERVPINGRGSGVGIIYSIEWFLIGGAGGTLTHF